MSAKRVALLLASSVLVGWVLALGLMFVWLMYGDHPLPNAADCALGQLP